MTQFQILRPGGGYTPWLWIYWSSSINCTTILLFWIVDKAIVSAKISQNWILRHKGANNSTWIKNFLTNRDQRIVVDGSSSNLTHVHSGMSLAQFYLFFLTMIWSDYVNCGIKLFAYLHTLLTYEIHWWYGNPIQRNLNLAALLEQTWLMKFNPDKCKTVHITWSRNPTKTDYVLHGVTKERFAT